MRSALRLRSTEEHGLAPLCARKFNHGIIVDGVTDGAGVFDGMGVEDGDGVSDGVYVGRGVRVNVAVGVNVGVTDEVEVGGNNFVGVTKTSGG